MDIKISRYGAYGFLHQESQILLTLKKSGPYKDLWDLPGGGIEFGETPEETLRREFLEETALKVDRVELLCIATSNGVYEKNDEPYHFHHIGIIYKIIGSSLEPHLIPEEGGRWVCLQDINLAELTPFAKHVVSEFSK